MYIVGAEHVTWVPTPRGRWSTGNGVAVPDGRIHAVEKTTLKVVCGEDDEITRLFPTLDFEQATTYDRCVECERFVLSERVA